ncbi:WD40 repeat domain-containing protein, partial [bacterium]
MKRFSYLLAVLLFHLPVGAQNVRPELTLQIGHMARITGVASSPDGSLMASGGMDETAKIWDAKTGALRFSLPLEAPVLAVEFQSDALLVIADAAGTLSAYETKTGALRGRQEGGKLEMSAAALSKGGKLAAFAATGGPIEIRDLTTGRQVAVLDGHPTKVLAMAFSPDGTTLASCSDAFQEKTASEEIARRAGDIRLWNVADGELIKILRGHALSVNGLAWSPDGSRLASVGESGTAIVWDSRTFAEVEEFNTSQGQGRATSVAFSPDNQRLLVSWRAGIKAFDLKDENTALWSYKSEKPV